MTDSTAATTWLTQEAFDKLTAELTELTGPGREFVVARIAAAREEGDLKENGGYHAAKDEQGKLEARIRHVEELLRHAQVGTAPAVSAGVAGPGCVVTARLGDDEPERFLVGSREETTQDVAVYSAQSPLGLAITGKKAGDRVVYTLPSGKTMSAEVLAVEPYQG